jgi:rubredoxin
VFKLYLNTVISAMGEAAYRTLVQKCGKVDKIPDGWKVLGLTQDAALKIYKEEKESGFKTAQEEIYGGVNERYNKKGQRIDANGFVIDEEDNESNERAKIWEDDELATSSTGAFECGNCGYTLFVAQGREAKFFGAGFKCPQCGSAKDQFKAVEDIE